MPFKFNAITGSLDLVNASSGGDVVGPASATDNAVARFDGTTGKLIKNSGVIIDNSNNVTGINELNTVAKVEIGDPGLETSGIDILGVTWATKLRVNDIGGGQPAQLTMHRHSTTWPTSIIGARANSDTNSHINVANNMDLMHMVGAGYAGSNYKIFGLISMSSDNTGTISNTSAPGKMTFFTTPDGSTAWTEAMRIDRNQLVSMTSGLSVTGNIAVTGTVDGVDVSALNSAYNSHAADASIHFTQGSISIPSTQISDFTEAAQDAVFNAIADSGTIDFTYNDGGNSFTGSVIQSGILASSIGAGTFANGSVIFSNGTNLTEDSAGLAYDSTNNALVTNETVVWAAAGTNIFLTGAVYPKNITVSTAASDRNFAAYRFGATGAATNLCVRARGTSGAPTVLITGDTIGRLVNYGYDGSSYVQASQITFGTEGTIGAGIIPGTIQFATNNSAGTSTTAVTINSSQLLSALKGISVTGYTAEINPTSAITNNPYALIIDGAGTNLVPNPSWENNITDSWTAVGTSTNTRDTTEKWIGTASLKIVSAVIDSGLRSAAIAVTSNTQYVFSVYVKGSVGGERFYISIDPNVSATVDSNNQGGLAGITILDSVNTEWSRITLPWTSGASDTSVELYLRSDTATAQTVYVDAVQFEQKTWPTSSDEVVFASSFIDGSMGQGYAWTGTAHNSTSTRTAGAKFLAPSTSTCGNFVLRTDGTIARFMADAKEIQSADIAGTRNEPNFPFTFVGNMKTNVASSGVLAGIVNVRNIANGTALHVDSAATTAEGFIISAASITSGSCMSVFAPSDLGPMLAANGKFFTFSGKAQNADMYSWYVDRMTIGQLGFNYEKNVNIFGGGSMTTTARVLAGTVAVTNANTTVTGTGTAFLTDFKRGQAIRINNGGITTIICTIASITSNTVLILTAGWTGATNAARTYDSFTTQYRPPVLQLEGSYANHGQSGTTAGDFMYGVFASGGGGQLHVKRSAARGVAVTPTADHDGHGLVTARQVLTNSGLIFGVTTETTMISGYTINAYELTPGGAFRISFVGVAIMTDVARTIIWRIKLGGTTILTSPAVQLGLVGTVVYRGVIEIYAPTTTTQIVSLSIVGKDSAAVTPGLTYSVSNLTTTGTVDMRIDQALTVTAQADAAGQVITVSGVTTEIL